jgi:hypothetical protein
VAAVDDQRIETMLKIANDPRLRAQRVAELLLQKTLSDDDMDELAFLLAIFFGFGSEFRKFLRHLKDYEVSEEEEAAEHALSKGVRELWLREHLRSEEVDLGGRPTNARPLGTVAQLSSAPEPSAQDISVVPHPRREGPPGRVRAGVEVDHPKMSACDPVRTNSIPTPLSR